MSLYLQNALDDVEARAREESEAIIKHQDMLEAVGEFIDRVNSRCDEHVRFSVIYLPGTKEVKCGIFPYENFLEFFRAAKELGVAFDRPEESYRHDSVSLYSAKLPGAFVYITLEQYQAYLAASEPVPLAREEVTA